MRVTDLLRTMDIHEVLNCPVERVEYVLNHPMPYGKLSSTELSTRLGGARVHEVPYGGEEVSRTGLEGLQLIMSRAQNGVSRAVAALATSVDRSAREALALATR